LETRIICDTFPSIDGVNVVERRWSQTNEPRDIAECDIGISFLPDHPWSLGKCGLKVLQYMAAGLPVVANPLGVHIEMIENGKTGFLCGTPSDWAQAIHRLARSPELRKEIGAQARTFVEQRYSISDQGRKLLDHLQDLHETRMNRTANIRRAG
jgi:hypothetical protein